MTSLLFPPTLRLRHASTHISLPTDCFQSDHLIPSSDAQHDPLRLALSTFFAASAAVRAARYASISAATAHGATAGAAASASVRAAVLVDTATPTTSATRPNASISATNTALDRRGSAKWIGPSGIAD